MNKAELNDLRKVMGTLPDEDAILTTEFHHGVSDMSVELVDYSTNPYKAMYVLATSCWGKKINKWDSTSIEGRIAVVKAVLDRLALPLAYEAPKFTFAIENIPRWSFDQIARARLGVTFSSRGTRDNSHRDAGFFIHDDIWENNELREEFKKAAIQCKKVYDLILKKGEGSYQSARSILPISNTHAFSMTINYAALQSMCSKRMKFCEADATVAFAWLLREEVKKVFPLLAAYLRPSCDFTGKCQYNKMYYLSNAFGCLFKPCGRNECDGNSEYHTENKVCSDKGSIEKQLSIKIPDANEDCTKDFILTEKDMELFEK